MTASISDQVTAFAPATVSNLGPGFDILGLAIDGAGDTVTARLTPGKGVRIVRISGDGGLLPRAAESNTAGIAATATLKRAGIEAGIELELDKGMRIGSGMGSSAASAVAAAFAVNRLVGSPLRKLELVEPCLEAEAHVSGRHADNVAPALLGGLILVRSVDPLDLLRLPTPEGLMVTVVTPAFEVTTSRAREVLPRSVPLSAMVRNSANLAAFVSACYSDDIDALARCVKDDVVTPVRATLIPGCQAVIDAARNAGALASSISGAGPSIFAFCYSAHSAREIRHAMIEAFGEHDLEASGVVSPINCPGVRNR